MAADRGVLVTREYLALSLVSHEHLALRLHTATPPLWHEAFANYA